MLDGSQSVIESQIFRVRKVVYPAGNFGITGAEKSLCLVLYWNTVGRHSNDITTQGTANHLAKVERSNFSSTGLAM